MLIDGLKNELLSVHRTLGWMDLVIANIDDSVCVVDEMGKIIFANDSFAHLVRQPRILLLGQQFTDTIELNSTRGTLNDWLQQNDYSLKDLDSKSEIYELDNEHKKRYIKLSANYLNTLGQTVLMLQDVTGQEELTMMRKKFISLASHQLRTPLSVINVHIQMLKDGYKGNLNPEQAELAENVIHGVNQMQQLVSTLLSTGRVEEGRILLDKKEVDVEDLILTIVKDLQPRLNEKELTVEIVKPKAVPNLISDANHLREIISNLLVNAIQYSRECGKITISIKPKQTQRQFIICIQDRGIGIPKENSSQIFSPFYRAENAITHFANGTGLGLYTVKLLVNELDGTINYKSIENKGTTFNVHLPLP